MPDSHKQAAFMWRPTKHTKTLLARLAKRHSMSMAEWLAWTIQREAAKAGVEL